MEVKNKVRWQATFTLGLALVTLDACKSSEVANIAISLTVLTQTYAGRIGVSHAISSTSSHFNSVVDPIAQSTIQFWTADAREHLVRTWLGCLVGVLRSTKDAKMANKGNERREKRMWHLTAASCWPVFVLSGCLHEQIDSPLLQLEINYGKAHFPAVNDGN